MHAYKTVTVKGYIDHVDIWRLDEKIAHHKRNWNRQEVVFNPIHYLALLERKPGALDHVKAFGDWDLPESLYVLRQRLETEFGFDGTREYIKVLRLLEKHSMTAVGRAVEKCLRIGALTRDAIAHFLYPQEEWRQTVFLLDSRPHLKLVKVEMTDVSKYAELLGVGSGS